MCNRIFGRIFECIPGRIFNWTLKTFIHESRAVFLEESLEEFSCSIYKNISSKSCENFQYILRILKKNGFRRVSTIIYGAIFESSSWETLAIILPKTSGKPRGEISRSISARIFGVSLKKFLQDSLEKFLRESFNS